MGEDYRAYHGLRETKGMTREMVAQAQDIGWYVIVALFVFAGAAIGFVLLWGRPREEDTQGPPVGGVDARRLEPLTAHAESGTGMRQNNEPAKPNRKLTQAEKTAKWLDRNQAIRRVK